MRWWPVFQRNLLVWKKLAVPSLVGNIAEPLMWLVAFGYGMGALVGQVSLSTPQGDIVPVAVISLVLAFVATIYPSWRASRVNPAEALRYE